MQCNVIALTPRATDVTVILNVGASFHARHAQGMEGKDHGLNHNKKAQGMGRVGRVCDCVCLGGGGWGGQFTPAHDLTL